MSDDYKDQQTNDVKDDKDQRQELVVGTAILLSNNRTGIIRYRGTLKGEKGLWFGVELIAGSPDKRLNNGVKAKKRYFFAPKGRAVFVQKNKIKKVLNKSTKSHLFNIVDPADRIVKRNPQEWTTNDVCRWLAKIDAMEAVTIFYVHGIIGTSLLQLSPENLEYRLGIKDKNLITQLFKEKERLVAQSAGLPDLREDVAHVSDEYKDLDRDVGDTVKRPLWDDGRKRNSSSPSRPKKRDSYSIPQRQRGKSRPKMSSKSNTRLSPVRDSLNVEQPFKGLPRFKSMPIPQSKIMEESSDELLTLSDGGDIVIVNEGQSQTPTVALLEDTPMRSWTCSNVAAWVDSLGDQAKKYSALFREKEITGSLLVSITSDVMQVLGVNESSARQWIIASRDAAILRQVVDDDLKID